MLVASNMQIKHMDELTANTMVIEDTHTSLITGSPILSGRAWN